MESIVAGTADIIQHIVPYVRNWNSFIRVCRLWRDEAIYIATRDPVQAAICGNPYALRTNFSESQVFRVWMAGPNAILFEIMKRHSTPLRLMSNLISFARSAQIEMPPIPSWGMRHILNCCYDSVIQLIHAELRTQSASSATSCMWLMPITRGLNDYELRMFNCNHYHCPWNTACGNTMLERGLPYWSSYRSLPGIFVICIHNRNIGEFVLELSKHISTASLYFDWARLCPDCIRSILQQYPFPSSEFWFCANRILDFGENTADELFNLLIANLDKQGIAAPMDPRVTRFRFA